MKKPVLMFALMLTSVLCLNISCQTSKTEIVETQKLNVAQEFADYWFQGKAELTSYKLEQARYGEVHPGTAVLIFVTEDFSRSKQVKLDNPQSAGNDSWKVLKLNATRKFNTGVYPYSMMSSTFTPLDFRSPSLLKATISSQEWCGHTFSQVNRNGNAYDVSIKSYFESEGDSDFRLEEAFLEDDIWSIIRLDPQLLPTGEISAIPSLLYQRLSHRPVQPESAKASLVQTDAINTYSISYLDFDRTLTISFNASFPYRISGWEEEYTSGFGPGAKKLKTRAMQDRQVMLDYWSRNSLADSVWRKELNLPF